LNIGDNVKTIASNLLKDCAGLTSVTIPNSVTSIEGSAFAGCKGLTSVNIGNGVTSIGSSVFSDCTRLKEFIVSENNTKYCSLDGALFNKNCTEFIAYPSAKSNSYTIPGSVTFIGSSAFWGCAGITSITIPNSVTSIGNDAFKYCTGLTSVTIPSSVVSIGNDAFGSTGLTSITIPSSVTFIGDYAFLSCTKLKEFIVSENNTKYYSLDGALFNKNCTELIKYPNAKSNIYTLPNSVTSIGDYAFAGCKGLASVTIPSSVISIGSSAFWGCTGITSITIPNSVTSIGNYAFSLCTGIKEIHCKTLTPPNVTSDTFGGIDKTTCKLYVPKGSYSNYWGTTGWGDFTNIIDE